MPSVKFEMPILAWTCSLSKLKTLVQASVVPVSSENTDKLFVGDVTIGDEESALAQNVQAQSIVDETHQPIMEEGNQPVNIVKQMDDNPAQ